MSEPTNSFIPYVPVVAAGVTALISAVVAWVTARRSVKAEVDKLKLGAQQKLLEQLVDARLQCYPLLYSFISDLIKAIASPNDATNGLEALIRKVNEWDSQHAILLGPHTSNVCYDFRKTLGKAAEDHKGGVEPDWSELFERAELLELALRSDLGIYGVELAPVPGSLKTPQIESY